jgi:hypothetical protein
MAESSSEAALIRFLMLFREFRAPFIPKAQVVADMHEGDQVMYEAMIEGDGLPALANLFIWTTLLERLRRLASVPKDSNAQSAGAAGSAWFDAAMVGGSLGFCADLLFGDTTGMKALPLSAFVDFNEPSLESALDLWREARDGEDVRAGLAQWAEQQGGNQLHALQMTRQALNVALLHQLQDMLSPGYLPRTVRDMQARTVEAYWRMPGARDPSDSSGSLN